MYAFNYYNVLATRVGIILLLYYIISMYYCNIYNVLIMIIKKTKSKFAFSILPAVLKLSVVLSS